jgi:gamma-glutamyltranspeptidase/glutathione hydrolase
VLAISVAGGDLQDQTTLNLLLDHIKYGMMPAEAVRKPRFATSHHQNSFDPNPDRRAAFVRARELRINAGVVSAVREELAARGHILDVTEDAIAAPVMLYIDSESGMLHAAGDPAAGRHASGFEQG